MFNKHQIVMTGIGTLDVIIALVFVFLIYSILASVIAEVVSDLLRLRSRNLEMYIRFMLSDDHKMRWSDIFGCRSKSKVDLFHKFIHLPSIKNLSRKRLLQKSGASYMKDETFVHGLIDSLVKEKVGKHDIERIQKGLDEIKTNSPETAEHIERLLERSNHDLEKFKLELKKWFNNSMERCASAYKQLVQWKLLIIGFVLAFYVNLNIIEVTKKLSNNEALAKQLAVQASQLIQENDSIQTIKKEIGTYQSNIEESLGLSSSKSKDRESSDYFGYLLAALGISLGAPFWFDLLGKLVKLRTAVQPADNAVKASNEEISTIKRVG